MLSEELRLDGQVAIVSGAGRGVGRAHALALAARGAKIVVNDLGGTVEGESSSTAPAAEVAQKVAAAGGDATANADDVSTPEGCAALVDAALSAYGRLDVVVANAGIAYPQRPFAETSAADFERMWRVHVGGTYNLLHVAWPHLVAQGYGRIVTTGSAGGFYGQPGSQEYSAAKGAIMGLTLSLAQESLEHGIRVNCLAPAAFTRMSSDLDVDEETAAMIRRLLDSALVSPAVVWLAHRSCPFNGGLFQAGAGRMARVSVGEPSGFWTTAPTPEELAAHASEIDSQDGVLFHEHAMAWAGWLITSGAQQAAEPAGAATQGGEQA